MLYWEKLFKALGIYDVDYHEKYRQYLHSERYLTYINLVEKDIRGKIESANKKKIDEIMKEKFPKPEFKIEDNR